jgi:dihydrolipoamide dehydrogenase
MRMEKYDLCIIGSGPAGYAAAIRAWDFGKKICLIEKGDLGGAGVHHGVLFSKTLWELSKDYLIATRRDRGYIAENVALSYTQVLSAAEIAIAEKVAQLRRQLSELNDESDIYPGSIDWISGSATFLDPHRVYVTSKDSGQSREVEADQILIATGSRPRVLDTLPIDGTHIMTSDHLMQLKEFPKSLVILGAGVVGCEFATIFANFGQTKVNVIDRQDRILPFEDEDISRVCSTNLEAKGVTIHHKSTFMGMEVVDDHVEYTIKHDTGGVETIRVARALISIGRIPNTDRLDIEKAGVELDKYGYVVQENTQTSVDHIYAAGDITYDVALANVGEIEGRYAVEKMFGRAVEPLSFNNMSTIIFADPEIAAIGMNEQQAQAKKIPYRVALYSYPLVNRAIAMRATAGFIKLLVTDDNDMKIIGMRCLGVHASTTIEVVSLMMKQNRSARDLAELIHPHPAITEGLQECVRMLMGISIYKPNVFTTDLRLSRVSYDKDEVKEEQG